MWWQLFNLSRRNNNSILGSERIYTDLCHALDRDLTNWSMKFIIRYVIVAPLRPPPAHSHSFISAVNSYMNR